MGAKKKGRKNPPPEPDRPVGERELVFVAKADAVAAPATADDVQEVLDRAGATAAPVFETGAMAAAADDGADELAGYYRVEADEDALDDLREELCRCGAVETAYVKPPVEPAVATLDRPEEEVARTAPAATPDLAPRQGYLNRAPAGVDARYAWTLPGGSGAGVQIIDIEGAWNFSHEDLRANQGGVVGGTPTSDPGWRNHGTAVIGEYGGDRNNFGVTGICPDAQAMAISIFGGLGSARAIQRAADRLRPGDVILIELHRPGPRHNFQGRADQRGYIAIEWWPDDWAAIRYATRRGVLVVEAAGNGAEDLDDPIYDRRPAGFPANWTNPFRRGARDSGAIVVGAGAPPPNTHGRNHGPDRSRLDFSNYGALVDAQGWGREVTTCGYGGLQGGHENQWYTDTFSGTSSASPIVVGALGCLQGILRRAGRPALTPATARAALRATGSPQTDAPGRPRTQRIGNRPDLRRLVARVLPGAGGGGQRRAATILPLHRYWNPSGGDHFYTTNWAELGAGRAGWRYEGIQAYLFPRREPGTVPLYRYWNPRITDHFYTTNWGELGGGRHGWRYEGIQGYVFPRRAANTTPLYRYWNPRIGDHFYTTNWRELGRGRNGWRYESVQCWVVPQALYVFPGTGTPEAEDIEPDAQEVAGATPDTFAARGGIDPALAGPEGGATLGDAADPDFPRFDLEPTNEAEAEVPAGMSDAFAHPEPGAMEDAGDSFTTTDGAGADPGPAQGGGSGHTTVHLNFR